MDESNLSHLGSMHIFCKAIAETAGIPYIVPPKSSQKTLTPGVNLRIIKGFFL